MTAFLLDWLFLVLFCFSLQEGSSFTNKPGPTARPDDLVSYADWHHLSLCGTVSKKSLAAEKNKRHNYRPFFVPIIRITVWTSVSWLSSCLCKAHCAATHRNETKQTDRHVQWASGALTEMSIQGS